MERSVVKLNDSKAVERNYRDGKNYKGAAEQSYRLTIPNIKFKSNLKRIYGMISQYDYVLSI